MESEVASSAPWIRARTSAATAGLNGIMPPPASGEQRGAAVGLARVWLLLRASARGHGKGSGVVASGRNDEKSRRNRRKRVKVGGACRVGRRAS
jgi:hypothetical protein